VRTFLETNFKESKDRWGEIMTTFLAKSKDELDMIDNSFKQVEQKYNALCEYLAEDPKTMQPEELFGILSTFITSLADARKLNEKALVDEEKNKRREEAKNKRQAELDNKK